ncbi:MAG: hypothetical protein KC561_07850, partial [Myxococcales bacterium]|nr:hypothetical protein [Myxococcales bacterium]
MLWSSNRKYFVAAIWFVLTVLVAGPAFADKTMLRHLVTDEEGNFTVLFSILDGNRDPLADPSLVPTGNIQMSAGPSPADLSPMELTEPNLTTLERYGAPFRIVILLPNTDQFNGTIAQEALRPDAAELRGALQEALRSLPQTTDITIELGFYNEQVEWIPQSFNATQIEELSSEMMRDVWVADPGMFFEDPFSAMDNAYRTRLRRQSQPPGDNFVHFFIFVTSSTNREDDESAGFSQQVERIRGLMGGRDMSNVVVLPIIYVPSTNRQTLSDPSRLPMRFATGVTPDSGTYRIVGDIQSIRAAMLQTIDEIKSSFILRFTNKDLESDTNLTFRMTAQPTGGEAIQSNTMEAHVVAVKVDYMKWIIIAGCALVGLVLLIILIVWLIRRPKKEKKVEVVDKGPAVELCVQCGRNLDPSLMYCPHCAAEPNYGLVKVLEGQ